MTTAKAKVRLFTMTLFNRSMKDVPLKPKQLCVSGAEMEHMLLIVLLVSKALSAGAQFNGYNCDGNFHSRFPGEKMTHTVTVFFFLFVCFQD